MNGRVLVVDDSLTVRKLIELTFRGTSIDLEFAVNGQDGIGKACRSAPDVILLDFVLPDMKGIDVCRELAKHTSLASTRIVVLSGKSEKVQHLFLEYPAVVTCLPKPFDADMLIAQISTLLGRSIAQATPAPVASVTSPPSSSSPPPAPTWGAGAAASARSVLSTAQKELLARAVYSALRPQLARIPQLALGLGDQAPAPYFAKRVITRDAIDVLVDELAPIWAEVGASTDAGDHRPLAGETGEVELAELVHVLRAAARTGDVTYDVGPQRLIIYVVKGEVMLVSCHDPRHYLGGRAPWPVPDAALKAAEAEQRASGRPLTLTLSEGGHLPDLDVAAVTEARSTVLIADALELGPGRFSFRERATPAFVERLGRPIGLLQARLERLRRHTPWAAVAACLPSSDLVVERSRRFSRTLGRLDLSGVERKLLTLVDGQQTIQQLAERTDLSLREALLVLYRAHEVGLVTRCGSAAVRATGGEPPGPVLVIDPDRDGVHVPLARLLADRAEPLRLVALDDATDCVAPIQRERPCLAIINASLIGSEAERAAQVISGNDELADLALIAVLETQSPRRAARLTKSGFDAVLIKPFHFTDLERCLPR